MFVFISELCFHTIFLCGSDTIAVFHIFVPTLGIGRRRNTFAFHFTSPFFFQFRTLYTSNKRRWYVTHPTVKDKVLPYLFPPQYNILAS